MKEQEEPSRKRIVSLIESPTSTANPPINKRQSTGISEASDLSTCQTILYDLLAKQRDTERSKLQCRQLRKPELRIMFSQLIDQFEMDDGLLKANQEIFSLNAINKQLTEQMQRQHVRKNKQKLQLIEKVNKLSISLAQLGSQNKRLREKADMVDQVKQRQNTDLKIQLQTQKQKVTELQAQQTQNEQILYGVLRVNDDLSKKIKQMQSELSEKHEQLQNIRKMYLERSKLSASTSQSSLRDRNNESRVVRLDNQISQIKRENLELEAQNRQLLGQLEALKDQLSIYQTENAELKNQNMQLTNQTRKNSQIEREFQDWKKQFQRVKQQQLKQERLEHFERIRAHERQNKRHQGQLQQSPRENSDEPVTTDDIKTYLKQRFEKVKVYERNELKRMLNDLARNQ